MLIVHLPLPKDTQEVSREDTEKGFFNGPTIQRGLKAQTTRINNQIHLDLRALFLSYLCIYSNCFTNSAAAAQRDSPVFHF